MIQYDSQTGSVIQYDKETPPPTKSEHALKFVWDMFQSISSNFVLEWKFLNLEKFWLRKVNTSDNFWNIDFSENFNLVEVV